MSGDAALEDHRAATEKQSPAPSLGASRAVMRSGRRELRGSFGGVPGGSPSVLGSVSGSRSPGIRAQVHEHLRVVNSCRLLSALCACCVGALLAVAHMMHRCHAALGHG